MELRIFWIDPDGSALTASGLHVIVCWNAGEKAPSNWNLSREGGGRT